MAKKEARKHLCILLITLPSLLGRAGQETLQLALRTHRNSCTHSPGLKPSKWVLHGEHHYADIDMSWTLMCFGRGGKPWLILHKEFTSNAFSGVSMH